MRSHKISLCRQTIKYIQSIIFQIYHFKNYLNLSNFKHKNMTEDSYLQKITKPLTLTVV
jgi:hypothetical protein